MIDLTPEQRGQLAALLDALSREELAVRLRLAKTKSGDDRCWRTLEAIERTDLHALAMAVRP